MAGDFARERWFSDSNQEGHSMTQVATAGSYAVDTREAARITGLAPATLNTLRSRGGGPPFMKIGRCVRYRAADLHRWLDERVVTSTADDVAGDI